MKELTLKQAAESCGGTLVPEQASGVITGVQIDSRKVKPGDLFVAIKGEKVDETFVDAGFYWYDASNMDDEKIAPCLYD